MQKGRRLLTGWEKDLKSIFNHQRRAAFYVHARETKLIFESTELKEEFFLKEKYPCLIVKKVIHRDNRLKPFSCNL